MCILLEPVKHDIDISTAAAHGEIVFLFNRGDGKPNIFDDRFQDVIDKRLTEIRYNPDIDYIVISGQMIAIVTMVGLLTAAYGEIRVLVFSAGDRKYVVKTIGLVDERHTKNDVSESRGLTSQATS